MKQILVVINTYSMLTTGRKLTHKTDVAFGNQLEESSLPYLNSFSSEVIMLQRVPNSKAHCYSFSCIFCIEENFMAPRIRQAAQVLKMPNLNVDQRKQVSQTQNKIKLFSILTNDVAKLTAMKINNNNNYNNNSSSNNHHSALQSFSIKDHQIIWEQ